MTKISKKSRRRPKQWFSLIISGDGLDSLVTMKVTARSIVTIGTCLLVVLIAPNISPDVATKLAFALIQLAGLIHRST